MKQPVLTCKNWETRKCPFECFSHTHTHTGEVILTHRVLASNNHSMHFKYFTIVYVSYASIKKLCLKKIQKEKKKP